MNSNELFLVLKDLSAKVNLDPGLEASVFFDIGGSDPAQWGGLVRDGRVSLNQGRPEEPDLTVSASSETAQGLYARTINPMAAFMTGKIKVKGDMSKAALIKDLLMSRKKTA